MANFSRHVIRTLSKACGNPHSSSVFRAQSRYFSLVRSVLAVPHHDAISKNEIFNNLYLKKLNNNAGVLDLSSNVTYSHHPTSTTSEPALSQSPPRKCWAEHVLSQHGNVDDVLVVRLCQKDVFNAAYASDQKLQFAFVQLKNVSNGDEEQQIVQELTRMCDDVNIVHIKLWLIDDLAAKSKQQLIEFATQQFKQECAV